MKTFMVFNDPQKAQKNIASMQNNGLDVWGLMYPPHADIYPKEQFIRMDHEYPGNTGRHLDLLEAFMEKKIPMPERDEWVLYSDAHDVRMQAPLPIIYTENTALVCDEGKTIGENEYFKSMYPEDYHELRIMNAGLFAMQGDIFIDYLFFVSRMLFDIQTFGYGDPATDEQKIEAAKTFSKHSDTLIFNLFLRRYKVKYENTKLFTCLAYQAEQYIVEQKDGLWFNKEGDLVPLVHYNGATDEYLND